MKLVVRSSIAVLVQLLPGIVEARTVTGSPVEKVVDLLKDMKVKLEDDQEREQQVYDKYACWCEKTTARKAEAIDQARIDLRALGQEILTQKAIVAQKTIEIQETTADIKENEEMQEKATAIRQKENEAYMTESSEMKQAIGALEKAVIVLRDATGFLQQGQGSTASVQRELTKLKDMVAAVPPHAVARLNKLQGPPRLALLMSHLDELNKGARYSPQSATITGILKDLYDTFASDLESMDSTEAEKNHNFEDLIATKQKELLLLQKKLADAEKAKAEAELMLAEATQTYDDTQEQLKADIEFFDATKSACTSKSDVWKERKGLRVDELAAIAKAVEILSSDEARELFGKAINKPGVQQSFLQLASIEDMATPPTRKAYQVLKAMATTGKSLRLARLAASVHSAKVGHFDEVLVAIDNMMADLKQEGLDDIAKRDQCKDKYQESESKSKDLEWKIEVNDATISKLEIKINELNVEKTATVEKIGEVVETLETMKTTRQAENEDFLSAKKDDADSIVLLEKAKTALAEFYKKNSIELGPLQNGGSLLQQGPEFERSADDAPDAEFSGKGNRKGQAKGIVALLTHIIEDLHGEISIARKAEAAAQLEYESQVKAANDLIEKLESKKVNLETSIAERGGKKIDEENDRTTNQGDLKSEQDYKKEIKPDCDFILEKFSERVEKREAEINGLTEAKEYLAGYQDSAAAAADAALLQGMQGTTRRPFDDEAFSRITLHGLA